MLTAKRALNLLSFILLSSSLLFPSSALAQKVVAVVDVSGGGCVMGGVKNGRWVEAEEMAKLLKGGERYTIYNLTRRLEVRTGPKPVSEGAPCSETMYVKGLAPNENERDLIAVGGNWNALPRVPKVESTDSTVYRSAVADWLRRKGISRPDVKLVKVLRVDLDGDGREEVLINATRVQRWDTGGISTDSKAGDYSVVLLRKILRGRVQTIELAGEYHPKEGRQENEGPPNEFVLSSVLDLNGDRRMEVIVYGSYYEGDWKTVYDIRGSRVNNIFGCGCGA